MRWALTLTLTLSGYALPGTHLGLGAAGYAPRDCRVRSQGWVLPGTQALPGTHLRAAGYALPGTHLGLSAVRT